MTIEEKNKLEKYAKERADEVYDYDVALKELIQLVIDGANWFDEQQRESLSTEKIEQALTFVKFPFSAYGIAEIVYPKLRRKHPKGHYINTGEGDVKIVLAKLDYVEDLGDGMYCIEKIEL